MVPSSNQRADSLFLANAVSDARPTEPDTDQLIPLCFCLSETRSPFITFPNVTGISQPQFFPHRVTWNMRPIALKVANEFGESLGIFDLRLR